MDGERSITVITSAAGRVPISAAPFSASATGCRFLQAVLHQVVNFTIVLNRTTTIYAAACMERRNPDCASGSIAGNARTRRMVY
jgi:hypothetical protein